MVPLLLQRDAEELSVRWEPAEDGAGERLEDVVGRGEEEEEELPEFDEGAFEVEAGQGELGLELRKERKLVTGDLLDRYLPRGDVERHRMR